MHTHVREREYLRTCVRDRARGRRPLPRYNIFTGVGIVSILRYLIFEYTVTCMNVWVHASSCTTTLYEVLVVSYVSERECTAEQWAPQNLLELQLVPTSLNFSCARSRRSPWGNLILVRAVAPLSAHLSPSHRYDKATNELVCDKLGVAYPIVEGIPHLVPGDGRVLESTVTPTDTTKTHWHH